MTALGKPCYGGLTETTALLLVNPRSVMLTSASVSAVIASGNFMTIIVVSVAPATGPTYSTITG